MHGILAAAPYSQPPANILFAAVQHLLLDGADPGLAAHYPSLRPAGAVPEGDPVELFAAFCRANEAELTELVASRTVQTNEVRRCTALLPAFAWVRARTAAPLALIEIGPSAGLNLAFDRYHYDYGSGLTAGDPTAALHVDTELRFGDLPPIDPIPSVSWRRGIDLHPVDLSDPEAVRWVRALLWPEQLDRIDRFERALAITAVAPPRVVRGDAVELLSDLAGAAPADSALVVYHSYVLNQFSPEQRDGLDEVMGEISKRREVHRVGMDMVVRGSAEPAPIQYEGYHHGSVTEMTLGVADHHGAWLRWDA